MGVSRREDRRNVILSEIIPWLIPFPFALPFRFCDAGTIPLAAQTSPRQKDDPSARIFRPFLSSDLINPYNEESTNDDDDRPRKGENFHSHRISGATLCILDGIHHLTRGLLPRETFPEVLQCN